MLFRSLKQDRPIPTGFMNALEFVVEFVRDSIVLPNVGKKWVLVWTPLILTLFVFIFSANAVGMLPIFDVIGLLDRAVLHTSHESWLNRVIHGGTTATGNFNVTAALATITRRKTPALLISVSFRRRVVSVMDVNGHADEHGRQKSEDVRLNKHHDHLDHGHEDRERHRKHDARAEPGGATELVRQNKHE